MEKSRRKLIGARKRSPLAHPGVLCGGCEREFSSEFGLGEKKAEVAELGLTSVFDRVAILVDNEDENANAC